MRQVLFYLPFVNLPIYGYGAMLFVAFVACVWLAGRLAKRDGIAPKHVQDLAIWMFVSGIVGARITFIIVDKHASIWDFFRIWDGGLVFYGSVFGGVVGFLLYYHFFLRSHGISVRKMLDILAPPTALGLAIGRVGCLLNGCCYGHVACAECPSISFPLSSPARVDMVGRGYQTPAGFTLLEENKAVVGAVEPGSPAWNAGLRTGDAIIKVNGEDADASNEVRNAFLAWPRGKTDLVLSVTRGADMLTFTYTPFTIPLHPTQIYETISASLIFLLLMAYYPLRHRDGMVMVLLMATYAVHRYLNEMLRTDTESVAFNMTFSQNVSIVLLAGAAVMTLWLYTQPTNATSPTLSPGGRG